ncbi:MAG: excinuclease ABC subunit UvrC [Candidatus Omnitrophica bacterium]|nr:excinuclease ABC subunit UvrC [Candidatus Omnitrophota bacterium]
MKLLKKVKSLPELPGVYLMKGKEGKILYVGKALSLKKRVGSYFTNSLKLPKQAALLEKVIDIDFVQTSSEAEALILEAGLIKEHKPKYNVAIKDDKAYPFLKLTINEKFPRLLICRRKKYDGACYFGPYTSSRLLRLALNFMKRIFPLRTCRVMPKTLCLNYHLNQCKGPCEKKIDVVEYKKVVENLLLFLRGKKSELVKKLIQEMNAASKKLYFEDALRLRDQIEALSTVAIEDKRYKIVDQLEEMREILHLESRPSLIEGYDISNISGRESVGSMVCFKDGYPEKKEYRRFKIRQNEGINDYAMIQEVLRRRFSGELSYQLSLPDLIVIDGGKGHLQSAQDQLKQLNIEIACISIAKRFEHIYVQWQSKPISLPLRAKSLRLIMRIRDEAHRFALSYHRNLRKKLMLMSELDQIPGIGEKRRKILLRALGDLGSLNKISMQQLKNVKGIDERTAKNIIEYCKKY